MLQQTRCSAPRATHDLGQEVATFLHDVKIARVGSIHQDHSWNADASPRSVLLPASDAEIFASLGIQERGCKCEGIPGADAADDPVAILGSNHRQGCPVIAPKDVEHLCQCRRWRHDGPRLVNQLRRDHRQVGTLGLGSLDQARIDQTEEGPVHGVDGDAAPSPSTRRVSQETLAEIVGTTRARVSFFMNKFRRAGFIEYDGGLKFTPRCSMSSCMNKRGRWLGPGR